MAHVTVTIDAKQFRMACDDGQEAHLEGLAAHLDERIKLMRQSFGEIGDLRLTVMAALMVCDELFEERRKLAGLEAAAQADREALASADSVRLSRETAVAAGIDALTARVERIGRLLSGQNGDHRGE